MNELAKIYETASNPGSFGGVDALYREAKRNKLKVTKKQVTEWLSNKLSYTLHKPVRKIPLRHECTETVQRRSYVHIDNY